jgi:hypothetical protein
VPAGQLRLRVGVDQPAWRREEVGLIYHRIPSLVILVHQGLHGGVRRATLYVRRPAGGLDAPLLARDHHSTTTDSGRASVRAEPVLPLA